MIASTVTVTWRRRREVVIEVNQMIVIIAMIAMTNMATKLTLEEVTEEMKIEVERAAESLWILRINDSNQIVSPSPLVSLD